MVLSHNFSIDKNKYKTLSYICGRNGLLKTREANKVNIKGLFSGIIEYINSCINIFNNVFIDIWKYHKNVWINSY